MAITHHINIHKVYRAPAVATSVSVHVSHSHSFLDGPLWQTMCGVIGSPPATETSRYTASTVNCYELLGRYVILWAFKWHSTTSTTLAISEVEVFPPPRFVVHNWKNNFVKKLHLIYFKRDKVILDDTKY